LLARCDHVMQPVTHRYPFVQSCFYSDCSVLYKQGHGYQVPRTGPRQVPAWATKRWLKHLSAEFPTLAFHASITNPFGKGSLLGLLRQLARLRSDKKYISVGFVGYPNVGKSSVINTLRTKKARRPAPAAVCGQPGGSRESPAPLTSCLCAGAVLRAVQVSAAASQPPCCPAPRQRGKVRQTAMWHRAPASAGGRERARRLRPWRPRDLGADSRAVHSPPCTLPLHGARRAQPGTYPGALLRTWRARLL